ncbi:unnamed protein product [Phytophthora fragariaefolia]|uniref:Unnamed protein product n=1 Tax=Phytophthora fragariaefolia TaxID=1490495 RepID=A0A9W6TM60_9STRA|nr:unnamed protein product [Phytophthora fragariaefolia]
MKRGKAHSFRELSLNVLANYPELIFRQVEANQLHICHNLDDKHHVFSLSKGFTCQIEHTWGFHTTTVQWDPNVQSVEAAVANYLKVPAHTINCTPHPWIHQMRPQWVGKRRWRQSSQRYKKLMNAKRDELAAEAKNKIQQNLALDHEQAAKALDGLEWKQVYRMEEVQAYHTQKLAKIKLKRLRIWAGKELGYHCAALGCDTAKTWGTLHLAWYCPEAQDFWDVLRGRWRHQGRRRRGAVEASEAAVKAIFGCKLQTLPRWIAQWGKPEQVERWEDLFAVALDMWRLSVTMTLTAIWRRNVDRVHPDGRRALTIDEATSGARAVIVEAFARYRYGLHPVTKRTVTKLQVAEFIGAQWRSEGSEQTQGHNGASDE